ncbi:MAG: hypothetical protein RLZZ468_1282 [Cyanobacteriota bacterium]|jgi:hypothetical protein
MKRPEPYKLADFCFWGEVQEKPQPPAAAGAALRELLARDLLPPYAIGPWCEDLQRVGEGVAAPGRLVWAAEDALLLAPWRVDAETWGGFMVAESTAFGQERAFYDEAGDRVDLIVPAADGLRASTVARAGAVLPIAGRVVMGGGENSRRP